MTISEDINNRSVISFTFDGLRRVVQRATFGTTTSGKSTLRGCLIDGESRRNTIPCWELYTESKIVDLEITGATFDDFACEGYTRGDSGFVSILAEH